MIESASDDESVFESARNPPDAYRVARRAVALLGMTLRAAIERDFREHRDTIDVSRQKHGRLLTWIGHIAIEDEFEPHETRFLETVPGELYVAEAQEVIQQIEAVGVLAWALRLAEPAAYEERISEESTWAAMGYPDLRRISERLSAAELRPENELEEYRVHHMEFYNQILQRDPDLIVDGQRMDQCHSELIEVIQHRLQQRLHALNWLCNGPELYSEVAQSET